MLRVNNLIGFGANAGNWAQTPIADQARGFAVNGWSFRKIRAAYMGPCCRLVRSSDGAQADFGFTPQNYVDIGAINTWLGGASPEVEIWYDQIGSTNWVSTFSTTSDRPNLVISGSRVWVETINAGGFTGGPNLSAWTALMVGRPQPTSWRTVFWGAANNSPVLIQDSSPNFGRFQGGFAQFGSQTWNAGENASFYLNFMGNPVTASKNNGAAGSAGNHSASRVPNGLGLNPDAGGIQPFGRIDEVLFFNADLPSDLRIALHTNHSAFYGVPAWEQTPPTFSYLLVGGGGGGGGTLGGGGGGGQVRSGISNIQINSSISVVRGTGGAGGTPVPDIFDDANYGSSGSATTATGLPSALGGAGGGRHDRNGTAANGTTTANGGGTGSWAGNDGGAGAAGGFAGGSGYSPDSPAGGGGGAGGPGGNSANSPLRSGAGGLGIDSAISGTLTNYGAGGGGNGSAYSIYLWSAGAAGGSSGGAGFAGAGGDAAPNRGGGGGGGGSDAGGNSFNGGNGANGVAIFSYPTGSMTATGGTITTSGGNTIHTFTSNGTFTRTA